MLVEEWGSREENNNRICIFIRYMIIFICNWIKECLYCILYVNILDLISISFCG